jgi:hypothetical protein
MIIILLGISQKEKNSMLSQCRKVFEDSIYINPMCVLDNWVENSIVIGQPSGEGSDLAILLWVW